MIQLDPQTTALVLIDLQKGILAMALAPYTCEQVMMPSLLLADKFRKAGAPVVLVNVGFAKDFKDALSQPVDKPNIIPPGGFPENFSELDDRIAKPGDIFVTKHQWGAFYGTGLDLQLRRRGIKTIVLGGVATNIGVESTARQAWEHGYAVILAEDATSGLSGEMHQFAINNIFPRISRVVQSHELAIE